MKKSKLPIFLFFFAYSFYLFPFSFPHSWELTVSIWSHPFFSVLALFLSYESPFVFVPYRSRRDRSLFSVPLFYLLCLLPLSTCSRTLLASLCDEANRAFQPSTPRRNLYSCRPLPSCFFSVWLQLVTFQSFFFFITTFPCQPAGHQDDRVSRAILKILIALLLSSPPLPAPVVLGCPEILISGSPALPFEMWAALPTSPFPVFEMMDKITARWRCSPVRVSLRQFRSDGSWWVSGSSRILRLSSILSSLSFLLSLTPWFFPLFFPFSSYASRVNPLPSLVWTPGLPFIWRFLLLSVFSSFFVSYSPPLSDLYFFSFPWSISTHLNPFALPRRAIFASFFLTPTPKARLWFPFVVTL